jgi:hypothetical protein
MRRIVTCLIITGFLVSSCNRKMPVVALRTDVNSSMVSFALKEIGAALNQSGYNVGTPADIEIIFQHKGDLGEQSYHVQREGNRIVVSGGDERGLMYAGIELSERISLKEDLYTLKPFTGKPHILHRGLRYNIPLDARTPSYDDTGDAAQKNIETVWDMEFWKFYLDQMARNRYNLLTLWSLHPYPSLVKVPEYPDVALDDVAVYTGDITAATDMKWKGEDIHNPASLKIVKKMTIDEKIDFWQQVFKYAEERGVDIYLFHWNVFVHGAEGRHGIEWKQDSPVTVDYIRKSVKQMLLTYPNIKGIGVTAGEHINRNLTNEYNTENWMWLTYGLGIMDAREVNPEINVRFIFRQHWSSLDKIMDVFSDYDGLFETSFKYSRARMYSSVSPPWFDKIFRSDVERLGIACWQNIRNDDNFVFRWGDPAYAREYVRNIPVALTPGVYMGPDGYVYGREFISRNPSEPRQYDTDKHWYNFLIWGHTFYNPDLPDSWFIDRIRLRFPAIDAENLHNVWRASSEVFSWVDKIHFRQNDAMFSPEGCIDKSGFHDVNSFIGIGAMPEQGVTSIADYALQNENQQQISPFEVADKLEAAAGVLIEGSAKIRPGKNAELVETLGDLEAMGYMARYYAHKVRGATYLAQYRVNGDDGLKENAINALEAAVLAWEAYSITAGRLYYPQLLARTGMLDWNMILEYVRNDVEIARKAMHGEDVRVTDDNTLWSKDQTRI